MPSADVEEHYHALLEEPTMAAWLNQNGLRQSRRGSRFTGHGHSVSWNCVGFSNRIFRTCLWLEERAGTMG